MLFYLAKQAVLKSKAVQHSTSASKSFNDDLFHTNVINETGTEAKKTSRFSIFNSRTDKKDDESGLVYNPRKSKHSH